MTQLTKGSPLPYQSPTTVPTAGKQSPKNAARRIRKDAAARSETISQVLLTAALIAILVVGSGITTGPTAFILLLSCIGVGIFLVRRSLASPRNTPY